MRFVRHGLCVVSLSVAVASCATEPQGGAKRKLSDEDRGVAYQRTKYYRALDSAVTFKKSPAGAHAYLADGTRLSIPELREHVRAQARSKLGVLSAGYHAKLERLSPTAAVGSAVYFRPTLDWKELSSRLYSGTEANRAAAREELQQAIAVQSEALAQELTQLGLTVISKGELMPVLFVWGSVAATRGMSAVDQIELVTSADVLPVEHRAAPPDSQCAAGGLTDSTDFHRIGTTFNDLGYYGAGQNIKLLEDVGDCTLGEGHEAFAFSQFDYSNPNPNPCVNAHGTAVASVISSSHDAQPRGAAQAHFYYPNTGEHIQWPLAPGGWVDASICAPQGTLAAYQWANLVPVVNESFGCLHQQINCEYWLASQWEGITQDYFARVFGTTIVKAAGNDNCSSTQEACPWTLNSICVGSVGSDQVLGCSSSTANYGRDHLPVEEWSDREEPDVVAFGGRRNEGRGLCGGFGDQSNSCVASAGTVQDWEGALGTSLAAPAVTAMIALYRECAGFSLFLNDRTFRALVRTAAYGGNPADAAYSTPIPIAPASDWRDGGGLLFADEMAKWVCTPGNERVTGIGNRTIDLEGGEPGEPPAGDTSYQNDYDPPGQTQSLSPQAFDYSPGPGSNRKWQVLEEFWLNDGARVRATFSWDACPIEQTGTAPANVATDFDLFLYSPDTNKYYWASQSLDDSNEGFDYTLQPGDEGRVQLILMWPQGALNCEGGTTEDGALAWRTWY